MPCKSLIVYYSLIGNTDAVAKEIQSQTGFDIQRIEEQKPRRKGNIPGAGMAALFGFKSKIKAMDLHTDDYDNIFLGAQVWAGKTTPAINSFLSEACFEGKKVWLFITKADPKVHHKIVDTITRRVEEKGGKVMDSISFQTTINTVIPREKVKDAINEWLKQNEFIG